jgi:hypothetical protein
MQTATKKGLKVFFGAGCHGSRKQVSIMVAASSRKKAVAALMAHGIYATDSDMATRWSCIPYPGSGPNAATYALAFECPERPFKSATYLGRDFEIVPMPEPRTAVKSDVVEHKTSAGPSI